jgi:hypothetical protein
VFRAARGDSRLRDDAARAVADGDRHQARIRLAELDAAGMRPGDLDLRQPRPVGLVGGNLTVDGRDREALEGELDVLGGHLAEAVGEHLPRLEREFDERRANLFQLGSGVELETGTVQLQGGQPLEHAADDVGIVRAAAEGRVERGDVALDADGDAVLLLGECRACARCERKRRRGCADERTTRQGTIHGDPLILH